MPPSFGKQEEPVFLAGDAETPSREGKPSPPDPVSRLRREAVSRAKQSSAPVWSGTFRMLLTSFGSFLLGCILAAGLLALYLFNKGSFP